MKPVYQRYLSDCVRACVASILELKYEQVPDFTPENWYPELQSWLEQFNLVPVNFAVPQNDPDVNLPPVYALGAVESLKNGWYHCVVTKGLTIVFDPAQYGIPLGPLMEICFLLPIDPAKCVHPRRSEVPVYICF